jgi:hypothetical protein
MKPVVTVPVGGPARRLPGRVFWAAAAVVLLVLAGAGIVLALWPDRPGGTPTAGPPPVPPGPPAPDGYSVAGTSEDGYRVFLPGAVTAERRVRKSIAPDGTVVTDAATEHWLFQSARGKEVSAAAYSVRTPAPVGGSADALWGELARQEPLATSPALKVEGKAPASLAGRPALEVRLVENKNWLHEHHPDEVPKPEGRRKDAIDEMQKSAQRWVYYVTADESRVYVLRVETGGRYADPGTLATVTGSFQFVR